MSLQALKVPSFNASVTIFFHPVDCCLPGRPTMCVRACIHLCHFWKHPWVLSAPVLMLQRVLGQFLLLHTPESCSGWTFVCFFFRSHHKEDKLPDCLPYPILIGVFGPALTITRVLWISAGHSRKSTPLLFRSETFQCVYPVSPYIHLLCSFMRRCMYIDLNPFTCETF